MIKNGQNREQLQMICLDTMVKPDSMVRVIDKFVDGLNLEELGFNVKGQIKNGSPAYKASDLLKLYYYAHFQRVRGTRRIEREAHTNIEVMWLIHGLKPTYKTIADFQKDNMDALENALFELNRFLKK